MSITILPNAKTQFLNGNAVPLAGGFVYMYVPNSSTFKTTWQDSGGVTANSNPIVLDANGECLLWGSGQYRQLVTDSLGNTIWDQITEDPGFAILATFNGTSTTSVSIGTGSKSFTTQSGLQFFTGGTVTISSAANSSNYMNGIVTSYTSSTGALVVNVLTVGGSGTHADWNIAVSGIQGPAGTVTAITIASTNGFNGSSSGGGTPALTIGTSVTGLLLGNGTAVTAGVAGTDYSAGTQALATGILKSTTTSGALSIAVAGDFPTLNQNTTGTAAHVTTNANLTGPVTSVGNATTITNSSVTEAMLSLSNNSTANVTTSAHGLTPILPNNAALYLNGIGNYTAPLTSFTVGTSTTSLLIGTGTKTYTTQAGLGIALGQFLVTASSANPANYMFGQVTSYSGTTLVLNVTATGGSGTDADWNISISGPPGQAGSVSTSGSPASGNLTKFSSSTAITTADLTGDITTSGTVTTTLATVNSNVGSFTNSSITVNGKGLITAASSGVAPSTVGFVNKFRNGTMDIWQRLTASTAVSTSGAYTADGWIVVPTGASCTYAQSTANARTGSLSTYSLLLTGAASVTDILVKQRIESFIAAQLEGQTVTVQAQVYNATGSTITPTLTVKHAGTADNWGSPVTDVSAVSLQSCTNTTWTQVAYTFTASTSSGLGLEITIDFGNNFSTTGKSVQVTELDIRSTPGVTTGLNASPPVIELPPISYSQTFCERYFRSITAPPGSTYLGLGVADANNTMTIPFLFRVPMRLAPTGITISNNTDFQARTASNTGTTTTGIGFDAASVTGVAIDITTSGTPLTAGNASLFYCASATGFIWVTGAEL